LRTSSNPPAYGIRRSVITTSNFWRAAMFSASRPFTAADICSTVN
jgi:hypothetical protein